MCRGLKIVDDVDINELEDFLDSKRRIPSFLDILSDFLISNDEMYKAAIPLKEFLEKTKYLSDPLPADATY